ncbi:MAG TPA: YihY/virulence factor BrkB family protein [Microscillaceae bacterium]|nr:YihY/virulence factor BrkB family protein [Microscillaceae bacterium]
MKTKIVNKVTNSKVYKYTVDRLRRSESKHHQVSWYRIIKTLWDNINDKPLHQQARAIAFSFTLSLFPAIIFLFTLIPFIVPYILEYIPDFVTTGQDIDMKKQVDGLLQQFMPAGIYEYTHETIVSILTKPRTNLLSFGVLLALYTATNGVIEMMDTFNRNYKFAEKRSFIRKRLIAAGLAILFALLMIVVVFVIIVTEFAVDFVLDYLYKWTDWIMLQKDHSFGHNLLTGVKIFVIFCAFLFAISMIYNLAPARKKEWRFFSLGATVASILAMLSTTAFSFYLSNFANYNKLYGSIGTLIALMFWLYLLAWVFLLGFELNASMVQAQKALEEEIEDKFSMLDDIDIGLVNDSSEILPESEDQQTDQEKTGKEKPDN